MGIFKKPPMVPYGAIDYYEAAALWFLGDPNNDMQVLMLIRDVELIQIAHWFREMHIALIRKTWLEAGFSKLQVTLAEKLWR